MNNHDNGSTHLPREQLLAILSRIEHVRLGVLGDVCIDIYWEADMTLSELSRETPHYPLPILQERMSPGAGGNVAVNLVDLGVESVHLVTVLGDDWRGRELSRLFHKQGINLEGMITSSHRITPAYCKPMRRGISDVVYEDPRLDFENHTPISADDEQEILKKLDQMAAVVDIIAVCDQFQFGILTDKVRHRLMELSNHGKIIVADSRNRIECYKNIIIKPNEVEAVRAVYPHRDPRTFEEAELCELARTLMKETERPLIITMGAKGSLWIQEDGCKKIIPIQVDPPVDIVGAGDTFNAAFCAAYGGGFSGEHAAAFGNIASSVVIRKLGTTGTASPGEILAQYEGVYPNHG